MIIKFRTCLFSCLFMTEGTEFFVQGLKPLHRSGVTRSLVLIWPEASFWYDQKPRSGMTREIRYKLMWIGAGKFPLSWKVPSLTSHNFISWEYEPSRKDNAVLSARQPCLINKTILPVDICLWLFLFAQAYKSATPLWLRCAVQPGS